MQTYIDFDGTLFDTDRYTEDFMTIFNEYGITKEMFDIEKKNLFNDKELFNINKITNYLIEKYNISSDLKNKISALLDKSYVYSDVLVNLETLIKNGYELYILSYGDIEFQKLKICSSNLSRYFKKIIITEKDKSKLNIDYKNSIFIDNNPNELEKFHESMARKIIRIRREKDKYSKLNSNVLDILECKDFNKVVELMEGDFFNE